MSFLTEVFAPVGGNFFAMPGRKNQTAVVQILTKKLEQDMKQSQYYLNVTKTMRSLVTYNEGGFHVDWANIDIDSESDRNVISALSVYNILLDPSVEDKNKIHSDSEFVAIPEKKNRLWLIRQAGKGGFMNLEEIINRGSTAAFGDNHKPDAFLSNKAKFYKNPPGQTNMPIDGSDTKTNRGTRRGEEIDWESFGLEEGEAALTQISGHEVVTMYCWINPDQFDIDRGESAGESVSLLELWRFEIVDSTFICRATRYADAREIPVYYSKYNQSEMADATRSLAEHVVPFQRSISFLLNTHMEGIRQALWGIKVYDPSAIDVTLIQKGETAGLLPTKVPNRDVRTVLGQVQSQSGTAENIQTAGTVMDLMKQFFPNQAMPSQIAGMDRAVTSQVSAVMQGSMRKMHMLVRSLDSSLMLPTRMQMYRNVARLDPDRSQLNGIKPEEVAELLGSGLGQINREAAAEQLRTIIFALIQNPDSAVGYDLPGLFTLWSVLQNIGTDLGEFIQAPPTPPATPDGSQPGEPVPVDASAI